MNTIHRSCLLFYKKNFNRPVNCSSEYSDYLNKALCFIDELAAKSRVMEKIPEVEDVFTPYGFYFGCKQKSVLKRLEHFKITVKYDLSVSMNCLYKVFFIQVKIDNLILLSQFHLLNNQLFLTRTDFLTQLYNFQYEQLLKGIFGSESCYKGDIGILPYYVRDTQSCLLQIHNPFGYPSLTYFPYENRFANEFRFNKAG